MVKSGNEKVKHDLALTDQEIAQQVKVPEGETGLAIMAKHNVGNAFMVRHTYKLLKPVNAETLEIGFGNGVHFKEIIESYPGLQLTGVELSRTMLENSSELNSELISKGLVRIVEGNITALPFKDQLFDRVGTINTVYYWGDTNKGLQEIYRVLRPGGQVVITFRPFSMVKDISYFKYGIEHLGFNGLEAEDIKRLMIDVGYKEVEHFEETDDMLFTDKDGKEFSLQSIYVRGTK